MSHFKTNFNFPFITVACIAISAKRSTCDSIQALVQVMNALNMQFEDDTFDLVWACESGEHMPDKKKYVEEMTRVLKPGTLSSSQ